MSGAKVSVRAPIRTARRDAVRNRERVLASADEVFSARGLDATLADIAVHAGVGVGTIYRNFADKDELIGALLEAKIATLAAIIEAATQEATGWDAFAHLIGGMSQKLLADRALTEILTVDHGREAAGQLLEVIKPPASRIIKRAQAEGTLRSDLRFNDLSPLLVMATATADFVSAGNPRSSGRYLEIMLEGLRARPDQGPLPGRALSDAELETANRSAPPRRR